MFLEAHMCKKLSFILVLISAVFIFSGCGNGSCSTTQSYGVNSFTKDVENTCVKKLAGATCYENSSKSDVAAVIAQATEYKFVFHKKECRDLNEKDKFGNDKRVECPDFIPKSIMLTKLTGCKIETLTDSEHYDCAVMCPQIFFETNNEYFKTASYRYSQFGDDYDMELISQSYDGKVAFYLSHHNSSGVFSWSETAEDGREINKNVRVEMEIGNSDTPEDEDKVLAQCEDDGGRIYTEGDIIPNECNALVCSEEGWKPYEAFGTMSCYDDCDPDGVLEIRYWDCPEGDELEWCYCIEEDENGFKWSCIERIDLQCPEE